MVQARKMINSDLKPYLIIEGYKYGSLKRTKMKTSSVDGIIETIQIDFGIEVIYSSSKTNTVEILERFIKKSNGQYFDVNSTINMLREKKLNMKSLYEQQLFFLQGISGVGKKRSEKLLDCYNMKEILFHLWKDPKKLNKALGEKTIKKIEEMVTYNGK
jgi:ERCC4-type nuclease